MQRLPSHHHTVEAPQTCCEAAYIVKETACLLQRHTCRQWGCCNVFCGMPYYCSHGAQAEHPAARIALEGDDALSGMTPEELVGCKAQLLAARKYMVLNQGWRHRTLCKQLRHWGNIGVRAEDVSLHSGTSRVLKNAHVVLRDTQLCRITVCVRGSSSVKDFCTSFTAVPMDFSISGGATPTGQRVAGHAHLGACLASKWLYGVLRAELEAELAAHPGWALQLTGHSIGGACAAMLAMRIRQDYSDPRVASERGVAPEVAAAMAAVRCLAIACPPCVSEGVADACAGYVLTIINDGDVVPLLSLSNGHRLMGKVRSTPWLRGRMRRLLGCLVGLPCTGGRGSSSSSGTAEARGGYGRSSSSLSGSEEKAATGREVSGAVDVQASSYTSSGSSSGSSSSGSEALADVPYVPELYPAGRILHMVPASTWAHARSAYGTSASSASRGGSAAAAARRRKGAASGIAAAAKLREVPTHSTLASGCSEEPGSPGSPPPPVRPSACRLTGCRNGLYDRLDSPDSPSTPVRSCCPDQSQERPEPHQADDPQRLQRQGDQEAPESLQGTAPASETPAGVVRSPLHDTAGSACAPPAPPAALEVQDSSRRSGSSAEGRASGGGGAEGGYRLLHVRPSSYRVIAPGCSWGHHWMPPYLQSLDRVLEALDARLGVGAAGGAR